MYINGINEMQGVFKTTSTTAGQKTTQAEPLLKFNRSPENTDDNVSDAKIVTENFKNEIMGKLDTSKADLSPREIKFYLGELIETVQTLNGVQKNNLKPNGTPEQNDRYGERMQEMKVMMNQYVEFVGSGLNVVQDSKTGLYKLSIGDKLYDIPERKVEITTVETVDGEELTPEIVD